MSAAGRALPVVTLTTDFGPGSPYVAAMKAAVLAGCPTAGLVDVSHEVAAHDVAEAAFVLWAGTRGFSPGSVHLAVVDPGVGGARRALALDVDRRIYVGPDNGIFEWVLRDAAAWAAVELPVPAAAAPTFHGRDVFAPAAGALAAGARLAGLGGRVDDPVRLPAGLPSVAWVDRFGNLVTDLRPPVAGVLVGGHEVRLAVRTYAEAPEGEPCFYTGSLGLVEVAVREGRADLVLGVARGASVKPLPV